VNYRALHLLRIWSVWGWEAKWTEFRWWNVFENSHLQNRRNESEILRRILGRQVVRNMDGIGSRSICVLY